MDFSKMRAIQYRNKELPKWLEGAEKESIK